MTITFDISTFTQYQKNMVQSVYAELLGDGGIVPDSISCVDGVCEIEGPSELPEITEQQILGRLAADDVIRATIALSEPDI